MKIIILNVFLIALGTGAVSHGLFLTRQKLDNVTAELRESRTAHHEAASRTVNAVDNIRLFLERDRAMVDAREKFAALQKQERDWTDLKNDAEARNWVDTIQSAEKKLAEIEEEQKRAWDSFNSLPLPADGGNRCAPCAHPPPVPDSTPNQTAPGARGEQSRSLVHEAHSHKDSEGDLLLPQNATCFPAAAE